MEIKFLKFQKICRTCFSDKSLKPIASITLRGGIGLSEILCDFISSEDLQNEKLPQNMCCPCVDQLNEYQKFKQRCKANELYLKSCLANEELDQQNETSQDLFDLPDYDDCGDNVSCDSDDDDEPLISRIKKRPKMNIKAFNKKSTIKRPRKLKSFVKKEDLSYESGTHTCKQCNKSFTFKYKLVMHMRVHTQEKPYQCNICHLSFSLNGNLKRHMMIHTGEKPHVCEVCGKGFIQATSLQNHTKKHHKENDVQKTFTCNTCCRVFRRPAPYNFHLKKHHPDKLIEEPKEEKEENKVEKVKIDSEYKCDICGKMFGKLILLQRHGSRHGDKNILCSECGRGFVRKADLLSHIKVHTGEKPHKCPICNKSFAHMGTLATHSFVHSGYKPYNCSVCSKSFSQISHLKVHLRIHSGERPYCCSYCGKTFALKSNLTVHIRTHTGETPYVCDVCKKGFYDSSSMKKHKLSHLNVVAKTGKEELLDKEQKNTKNEQNGLS